MISRHLSILDVLGREAVHPFPARMAATVALKALSRARGCLKVLDPMMGSGTALALAQSKGHSARGIDIDPLAVLIGQVWTTPLDKAAVRRIAAKVLAQAKHDFTLRMGKDAYPSNADSETKKFIRYWFDPYARRQLACLSDRISRCRGETIRRALWCAFSRLIIAKQAGASLALDLSHSRPHRFFEKAPRKPFPHFLDAVEQVLVNCPSKADEEEYLPTFLQLGDARSLTIRSRSIDLVLTSPPYLNAIDYMRCSKFSLVWMGHSAACVREVRGRSIGTEVGQYAGVERDLTNLLLKSLRIHSKLSTRHKAILRRFIEDMALVISEAARVLVPGGKAIFVVGENTIRGTYIRNAKIISRLAAEAGLKLKQKSTRVLPANRRYLPPPRAQKSDLDLRMRREVVLTFAKPRIRPSTKR